MNLRLQQEKEGSLAITDDLGKLRQEAARMGDLGDSMRKTNHLSSRVIWNSAGWK